jgi:hypothetical protein
MRAWALPIRSCLSRGALIWQETEPQRHEDTEISITGEETQWF